MKKIFIKASELAKITGHNKFGDPQDTLNTILSANNLCDVYVFDSNTEKAIKSLPKEELKSLKKDVGLQESASYTEVEKAVRDVSLKNTHDQKISESESIQNLEKNIANTGSTLVAKLSESISHDLRMERGTLKEEQNLDSIQAKENIVIKERNSKLYVKELYRDDNYAIILRGKVDGISGDTIIETKNRTRKLFYKLRDYERVQLEAYMFLTGKNKSLLTEHYDGESSEISYDHNQEFWDQCIDNVRSYIKEEIEGYL